MDVLLDLWGVLLDSDRMQREYGRELARRMSARFGGSEEQWLHAHTAAWTEYVRGVEAADWNRGPWSETIDRLDAAFGVGILDRMGVAWRPEDPLGFSHELDATVMSGIDARFPDTRAAVERLRSAAHRVFVATQATESNARGALTGAGLLTSVDGLFTGTSQNASKSRPEYWHRVRETLGSQAAPGIVVDDRADYLSAAASSGFVTLLLDRDGIFDAETVPGHVQATLRNLAGLPHFVDVLEKEANHGHP